MTELLKVLKDKPNCENLNEIITKENLVSILELLDSKQITRPNSKILFENICFTSKNAKDVAKELGMLSSLSDEEIKDFVKQVINTNPDAILDFEKNPNKVIMFYTGKVMALTKGKANPITTQSFIKEILPNYLKK